MKKTVSAVLILLILCTQMLAACDQQSMESVTTTTNQLNGPTTAKPQPSSPGATTTPTTQMPTIAPTEPVTQPPEATEPETQPTQPVTAPTKPETEPTQPDVPVELPETNIYLVGDSTVCGFSDTYFYPRYGYGTQLDNFMTEKVTIHNLALSGRSSKSFLLESNYQTLKDNLQAGDYLIIAFGHNDQKNDDDARFTDASKDYTDPSSFGYSLYEYYIKLALDAGATPILCTPIVRAASDNDYTGSEAHVTATGDYRQAILDLAAAVNVPVVDLTAITKARYEELGFDEAILYHAMVGGIYDSDGTTIIPNVNTVDKTHLNIYGAKYVAYRLACELQKLDCISGYVLDELTEPTIADLSPNPNYIVTDYAAPDLDNYSPANQYVTTSDGWYGTAFGDTGGNPQSSSNGYIAKETAEGIFQVGQSAGSNKGKFSSKTDGFAFVFRQVEADKNFSLTVTASVIKAPNSVNQAGFGLMLRDDVYINATSQDSSIISNYVTAGVLGGSSGSTVLFSRENTKLDKGTAFANAAFVEGDTFTMTIERIGQSVTVTVIYGGITYSETYYDFDFLAKDTQYMYVGMFANRGTIVEYTNVVFTELGDSMGA